MTYEISSDEAHKLTMWYDTHKRSLPWRDTGNPYDIWLSEIMLQQTRIEAVRPKYLRFKKEIPDIKTLAETDTDRLLYLWEGLGYYSRIRNMHKCAQVLVEKYDGKLPADYNALLKLPGIGSYTAGAIASIAYGIPVSAVDGNVMRVLARYFEIDDDVRDSSTKKMVESIIMNLFSKEHDTSFVSSFNQGLMELGETVCLPNALPQCNICPWSKTCHAYKNKTIEKYPYRSALKERKIIHRTIFVIRDGNNFLLHKRPDHGLLARMYEFPGTDSWLTKEETIQELESMGLTPLKIKELPDSVHKFTHLEWQMKAYEVTVGEISHLSDKMYILADKKSLSSKALPSAFSKYIQWYALRD